MRKIISFIVILILMIAVSSSAFAADGNVIYSGNAGEFIFEPGSKHSLTDLFTNFKDVMPGDILTQGITVRNNAKKSVRISMRALGAHEDSIDFLSQLNLYVEKVPDTPLFEAPADETAQLTEWRELGIFAAGAEIDLKVGLEVPASLDNTNKNQIGYLDWEFMVEEIGEDDPKTGDEVDYSAWIVGIICAGVLIVVVLVKRRKDNGKDEAE